LHFLAKGEWSDAKVLGRVRDLVLPQMNRHGPIEAWIVDDTSFPKCGSHSDPSPPALMRCRRGRGARPA